MGDGSGNFRYLHLADYMESKIMAGVYKAGEKLPSIRKLRSHTGLSITTVYQAYIELEKRGVAEPRRKSGYYVRPLLQDIMPAPDLEKHEASPRKVSVNFLFHDIVADMSNPEFLHLGGASPVPELFPCKALANAVRGNPERVLKYGLSTYENPVGAPELRRLIAQRALGAESGVAVDEEEIVVTNGCMEAIHLCLRAVAEPGDAVAVESPTFHGFLQLLEDLNLFALEIPTDPKDGVDLDLLEKALDENRVKAGLFVPNFQNPLGSLMPEPNKRRLVEIFNRRNVPIIEDGVYRELYFENERPRTLKSFDRDGMVLYCSSFSKSLSPGLRVGWTMPGRFYEKIRRLKLSTSICSGTLNQAIVARFLKFGGYERHLRKLRTALKRQTSDLLMAISRYFPQETRVTAPSGGLVVWVRLPPEIDSVEIYKEARKKGICVLPGQLCSTRERFRCCLRLSCANPWTPRLEEGVKTLGELIENFLERQGARIK